MVPEQHQKRGLTSFILRTLYESCHELEMTWQYIVVVDYDILSALLKHVKWTHSDLNPHWPCPSKCWLICTSPWWGAPPAICYTVHAYFNPSLPEIPYEANSISLDASTLVSYWIFKTVLSITHLFLFFFLKSCYPSWSSFSECFWIMGSSPIFIHANWNQLSQNVHYMTLSFCCGCSV